MSDNKFRTERGERTNDGGVKAINRAKGKLTAASEIRQNPVHALRFGSQWRVFSSEQTGIANLDLLSDTLFAFAASIERWGSPRRHTSWAEFILYEFVCPFFSKLEVSMSSVQQRSKLNHHMLPTRTCSTLQPKTLWWRRRCRILSPIIETRLSPPPTTLLRCSRRSIGDWPRG
jgi:hypothetical protein